MSRLKIILEIITNSFTSKSNTWLLGRVLVASFCGRATEVSSILHPPGELQSQRGPDSLSAMAWIKQRLQNLKRCQETGHGQGRIPGRGDLGMCLKWKPDREVASTRTPHPRLHWAPPKPSLAPADSLIYAFPAASLLAELWPQTSGPAPPPQGWGREWGEAWPQRHPTPHPSFPLLSPLSPPGMKKWDVSLAQHHFIGLVLSLPLPMRLPHTSPQTHDLCC